MFLKILHSERAVIGGEIALQIALHALTARPISSPPLAIYVPFGSSRIFKQFFGGQGYGRASQDSGHSLEAVRLDLEGARL